MDYKKQEYYPTPEWCVEALLDNEKFKDLILEPACGKGYISKKLIEHDYEVLSSDKYDYGYGLTFDFLSADYPTPSNIQSIITNPPFSLANDFVIKSLLTAKHKVALLMRLAFLEGSKRQKLIFRDFPPSRIHVFSERITFYPDGIQTAGSGTMAMAWFVWDMNNIGTTTINWLNGYKPK